MFRSVIFVSIGIWALQLHSATAQETVESLKKQVESLELKLQLAETTISILEKDRAETSDSSTESTESDPFRAGAVWAGSAVRGGTEAKWALSIAQRDGEKFSGGVAIAGPQGKKFEFPVHGTAPVKGNGLVVIESPLMGRRKAFFRGRMVNGKVALAFSLTGENGEKNFGSATLLPQ